MNRLRKRIQDFHVRRRERDQRRLIERWGAIRAKGKARFVLRSTLTGGLGVAAMLDIAAYITGTQPPSLLFNLIIYSIIGFVASLYTWWDMEGRYNAYRKSLRDSNTLPQRQA